MPPKKTGMGKGLEALLGEDFSADFSTPSSTLPISQIEPCRNQPRKKFDQGKLEELAESIRQHGVIQPLTVRKLSSGYYQIIAGERRWRAARQAGLTEIPAVVIEADDQKAMELAMIENLQREDLDPIEEANGFRVLVDQYGMTQEEAARRVGKSRSAVTNALRLLDLSQGLQELVIERKLSAGHARALLPLPSPQRRAAATEIMDKGLNVRQTEQLVKRLLAGEKLPDHPERARPLLAVDYVREAEKALSASMGRACHITQGKRKGKIEIEYYGVDDLNNLLEVLEEMRR